MRSRRLRRCRLSVGEPRVEIERRAGASRPLACGGVASADDPSVSGITRAAYGNQGAGVMESAARIGQRMRAWAPDDAERLDPNCVHVDLGYAPGVVDRLRKKAYLVDVVDFGRALRRDWPELCGSLAFKNRRAELHWKRPSAAPGGPRRHPRRPRVRQGPRGGDLAAVQGAGVRHRHHADRPPQGRHPQGARPLPRLRGRLPALPLPPPTAEGGVLEAITGRSARDNAGSENAWLAKNNWLSCTLSGWFSGLLPALPRRGRAKSRDGRCPLGDSIERFDPLAGAGAQ
jgi:hypothetical protein